MQLHVTEKKKKKKSQGKISNLQAVPWIPLRILPYSEKIQYINQKWQFDSTKKYLEHSFHKNMKQQNGFQHC